MKSQTEDHPRPGYHEFLGILKKRRKTLKAEKHRVGQDCSEIQGLCFLQGVLLPATSFYEASFTPLILTPCERADEGDCRPHLQNQNQESFPASAQPWRQPATIHQRILSHAESSAAYVSQVPGSHGHVGWSSQYRFHCSGPCASSGGTCRHSQIMKQTFP